jgi:uncharacterized protein (TIGR00297 family)
MLYFTGMIRHEVLLFFILGSAMMLSVAFKKLTLLGALTGGLLGLCVYAGGGFTGLALMAMFFVLGVCATAVKRKWKERHDLTKKGESRRTAGQVFANGGVAGIIGLLIFSFPQHALWLRVMLAASLSSATADTMSSELGVVYGRFFYNIRTFQKDTRGLDGVISWEGTLLSVVGSCVIALVYSVGFGFSIAAFWIIIAGTVGNLCDSLLGATLERAHRIGNNTVNFLNTLIAALVAAALMFL